MMVDFWVMFAVFIWSIICFIGGLRVGLGLVEMTEFWYGYILGVIVMGVVNIVYNTIKDIRRCGND